jgi:predicted amidophosphoribosyltransferase
MAAQIAGAAPSQLLSPPDAVLVPVPAQPARRRARGYDQAELIAGALSRRTGLRLARVLSRRGAAGQLGAAASVRRAPGRLDIRVRSAAPWLAVLVDDVHTTGATLDACAAALKRAGTRRVVALTWARTLDRGPVDTSLTTRTIDGRTSFSTERTPT